MKTATLSMSFRQMPKLYAGLVRMLPPRPLHDKADLESATEILDAMAGHELTPDQEDCFESCRRPIARDQARRAMQQSSDVILIEESS
jgi:hypothetical protein